MKKFIRRIDNKIFKLCRSFDNLLDKLIGGYWRWLTGGGILTNIKNKPTDRENIIDKLIVIIGSEISNKINITVTTNISLRNLII